MFSWVGFLQMVALVAPFVLVPPGKQGKKIVVSAKILLVFCLDLHLPGHRI